MSARMSSSAHEALVSDSNREFLQQLSFDRTAPTAMQVSATSGNATGFSGAYRKWLRSRLVNARVTPGPLMAAWSLGAGADASLHAAISAMTPATTKSKSRRPAMKSSATWADHARSLTHVLLADEGHALDTSLGLLAALEVLAMGTSRLPVGDWWALWQATYLAVQRRDHRRGDTTPTVDEALIDRSELPLLIGWVFAPLLGMSDQVRDGRRQLGRSLTDETDTDGTPAGHLLSRLPLWLAPLVRSAIWSRRFDEALWTAEQQRRFNDVLERAVALSRADGRLALTNGLPSEPFPLLQTAANLLDWSATHPGRSLLRSVEKVRSEPRSLSKSKQTGVAVMPSNQSDWARFALLRTDWSAAAASVAIAHHASLPEVDATIDGQALLHGAWGLDLQLGDATVELADEWACVCWESDPDADYAELQMTGPNRLRVERMVLLSRRDKFLLVADAISGAPAGRLRYRSRLPLAPGVKPDWLPGRRELVLTAGRSKARVLPLALPEDTTFSSPHRFEVSEHGLVLEQVADGQGLLAPLVIDWHPNRRSADALWRKLTVTEAGQVLSGDAAAAYRWQIGKQQWLLLRALKRAKVPRAVLGLHTANETVIGRFESAGTVNTILAIEP
jgi:hypothetical protein